jgi:uncharacterized protein (TIGR03435 family)
LFPVSRRGGNIPVETMSEPDSSLIAEFNARRSEDAFAALVRQHVNLVFATALRQVGDAGAAEEITQNVFVALAQAAGKLGSHPTIAGWLHQTALNKSREWLRSELRCRKREQVAVNLDLARAEGDSVWSPLVPLLDEALLELREPDRQAVILHYMEGRTFQEVGSALGVGEDAARKRVHRCLDQLTDFFRRHGFAVPALGVGAPLFALSSHAAPAGLAASAATAGLAAAHSAASTSTLTLIKGALKIMAWTKMKTAVVAGVIVLLAAGTTTVTVKKIQEHRTYSWQVPQADFNVFYKSPPTMIIVPTKFAKDGGACSDGSRGAMGIAQPLKNIIQTAYGYDNVHTLAMTDLPTNRYDFMAKLVGPEMAQNRNWTVGLQKKIASQFKFTGRVELRDTPVLILVPGSMGAHGFKVSHSKPNGRAGGSGPTGITYYDQPISTLISPLEQRFQMPIVDWTGLKEHYDFSLTWDDADWKHPDLDGLKQALREQLGLELVATNLPVQMLVVEKAK